MTNHLNITHWNVSVWMCLPASLHHCALLGCLKPLHVPAYPHSSWSNAISKRIWYPLWTILNSVWQENETMWEVQTTAIHVIPFTGKILETGISWWSKSAAEAGLPLRWIWKLVKSSGFQNCSWNMGQLKGIVSHLYCIYMNVVKLTISKEPNPLKFAKSEECK